MGRPFWFGKLWLFAAVHLTTGAESRPQAAAPIDGPPPRHGDWVAVSSHMSLARQFLR